MDFEIRPGRESAGRLEPWARLFGWTKAALVCFGPDDSDFARCVLANLNRFEFSLYAIKLSSVSDSARREAYYGRG